MSLTVIEQAYAKVNLCLFLGPTRDDGRHELVTAFDSVRLTDELVVGPRGDAGAGDEVHCAGVPGPNLVGDALAGLRAAGWSAPPVRVEIFKRIPVAAGMGGGSADAAAMLRCAPRLAGGVTSATLASIAASLGADVPGQLVPGPSLGTGAGEVVAPCEPLRPYGVLVLPSTGRLSTPEVYREADRLGLGRTGEELSGLRASVAEALTAGGLPESLTVNDLQAAALSLMPSLREALAAARDAGADRAMVCGSGPTVIGIFTGERAGARARAAAAAPMVRAAFPAAVAAAPFRSAQSGVDP